MTDEFEDLFHKEAHNQGAPELPYVLLEHPIGGLRREALLAKARAAVDGVERALRRT